MSGVGGDLWGQNGDKLLEQQLKKTLKEDYIFGDHFSSLLKLKDTLVINSVAFYSQDLKTIRS